MILLQVGLASRRLVRTWIVIFGSVPKVKRDRDQNVVQTLRERQHLHNILERKAELAVRGEELA